MASSSSNVLVTGTATGIGHATTLLLADQGFRVFACVRKSEDADNWQSSGHTNIEPILLDVTDAGSIARATAQVAAALEGQSLDALVNNAGYTVTCPMEFVDLDEMRAQFEVNVFGVAAVTKALMPLLARPGGRIVNVSSGAGKIAPPLIGPYTASKHALEAMTDSMRLEIRSQGISVSLIVPGFIKTEIHGKNDASTRNLLATLPEDGLKKYGPAIERLRAGDKVQSAKGAPASEVATAIYRALTDSRPRNRYPVTREAKLLGWIGAFLSDRRREKIFGKQFGL